MPEQHEIPLTGLVWRLSMRWRSAIDRAVAPFGITHAQYALLAPLLGMEGAGVRPSQRQLADSTGLEPLYVSKLARALERAGLIERAGHPHDARAVRLALTEQGRDVTVQAIEQVVGLQDELTEPLGGPHSARTRALIESLQALLGSPAESAGRRPRQHQTGDHR